MSRSQKGIVGFATQGSNSGDAERLRTLVSGVDAEFYDFQRSGRGGELFRLLRFLRSARPRVMVMEGTGIAGGAALILARLLWGVHYVVSSGDAVGPFVRKSHPILGLAFSVYERVLCRLAAGYIGWTPYLTGRALTFGCPRGMTASGWAPVHKTQEELLRKRSEIRRQLGISQDAIVVGLAGSLKWNPRFGFCYGYELVQAVQQVSRKDVVVLIVGDGDGKRHMEQLAGADLGKRVLFPGRVPRHEVLDYLAAMDIASLPQSLDGVGNFRYTTKVSEYVAAGLPIVTGHLPMTYDLPSTWFWTLAGDTPWSPAYIAGLAGLLEAVSRQDIVRKRTAISKLPFGFDKAAQIESVTSFLSNLLAPQSPFQFGEREDVVCNVDQQQALSQ